MSEPCERGIMSQPSRSRHMTYYVLDVGLRRACEESAEDIMGSLGEGSARAGSKLQRETTGRPQVHIVKHKTIDSISGFRFALPCHGHAVS